MANTKKNKNLSKAEKKVIKLMINGFIDKEIAHELGISYGTVRTYIDRAMLKTSCVTSRQLCAFVVANNLLKEQE